MIENDIERAIAMARAYYAANPAGGNLHVVLDDGNMDSGCITWSRKEAENERDYAAINIADHLLTMSEDDRYKVYDRYDEYAR